MKTRDRSEDPIAGSPAGRRPPPIALHAAAAGLLVASGAIGAALVVAAIRGAGGLSREELLGAAPLAALLAVAAAAIGYACGDALAADLQVILDAARAALGRARRSVPPAAISSAELGALADAVTRLEARFRGEMALYDDALAEVETLDGQRTDLLSAVATELYAPLERVVRLSERILAGADGPADDAKAEDARIVRNASVRLREMVAEILDLSALISRDVALEIERLDLAAIAREVVETARGQIGAKKLVIRLEAEEGPVPIDGHRGRLWQIAMNLVGNAIKFTEAGAVTVRVSRLDGGGARLDVVDTGVGIASMDQASVFDTFRQLGGRAGRGRGTGLGLAICKRLVELHRGKIAVSSLIGQGTRFAVTFPPPGEGP